MAKHIFTKNLETEEKSNYGQSELILLSKTVVANLKVLIFKLIENFFIGQIIQEFFPHFFSFFFILL